MGNKMEVTLNMGGHEIKNAGIITAYAMPAAEIHQVAKVKFKNGWFSGRTSIAGTLVVGGAVALLGQAKIITPTLDIKGNSRFLNIDAANAALGGASLSQQAQIETAGAAVIRSIMLDSLLIDGIEDPPSDPKTAPITITGENLSADVGILDAKQMSVSVITIKNGYITSGDFDTIGGNMNFSTGARTKLYATRQAPSAIGALDPRDFVNKLDGLMGGLWDKIEDMWNAEAGQ
jgi:hypothetical protein